MKSSNAHEDLAYVRAIAEEGRNVPLVGGLSFLVWGGIIGTTALIQYGMVLGWLPRMQNTLYLWSGAFVLGWGLGLILDKKISRTPGASTLGNRIVNAAWGGCGIFITLYFIALSILFFRFYETNPQIGYIFNTMFPVAFGLYGMAFMVTAVASNQGWFRWVSFASWAISFILLMASNSSFLLLIAGLSTYAVVLVPGLIMLKNQPSDII